MWSKSGSNYNNEIEEKIQRRKKVESDEKKTQENVESNEENTSNL